MIPDYLDHKHGRPKTMIQAIMESRPGVDPDESTEEFQERRAAEAERLQIDVGVALLQSGLTYNELLVVRLVLLDQLSVRDAAAAIGISKSEVHRISQRLVPRLKTILAPLVKEKYGNDME